LLFVKALDKVIMQQTMSNQSTSISHCNNCGEYIEKKYCSQCGQKHEQHRIHLKSLLHDIPHAIFHVDHGFFYNVVQLFRSPGAAIREYLTGKRKRYFHPITYLAILLVLNLFVVKITNLHFYDEQELLTMSPAEVQFIKEYDAAQWWFLEHTYLYMLLAIPVCAAFCYGFFRLYKVRYNFAENAIILMFIIAQGVLIQSVLYLATGWVSNGVFIRSMEMVNFLLMISYAGYAMYKFINPATKKLRIAIACLIGGLMMLSLMLVSSYLLLWVSKL
jgi:hypothetical protein